ncbi:MAG: hypothetical protein JSS39_11755 [Nitrospira sp.]|nr:hypothetical protein [Nitrospira sp.]
MSRPLVPTSGCAELTGQSDDGDATLEPPSHHVSTDIVKPPRPIEHIGTNRLVIHERWTQTER